MNFDNDAPLNRIKGESKKAHLAFMDYFLAGVARTLRDLHQKYQDQAAENEQQDSNEQATEKPPTISWWTIGNWSKNNHWQARIVHQTKIDNEIALEQYRQRHMSEAEVMARLADMGRADIADFADVRQFEDLKEIKQSFLVKKFIITERKSGDDTEIVKMTIELYNAQKALELLGKDFGRFKDRLDITSGDQPFTIDDLAQAAQEITDWEDENSPDPDPTD
jgi:hypothetical protein